MFYEDVLRALVAAGCRFLIVGGVAVNLHGIPRMTADLDLLLDLEPANVENTVKVLQSLGYLPRAPVDPRNLAIPAERESWVRDKGMKAFSFFHPAHAFQVVDLLVDAPIDYVIAAPRAIRVSAEGLTLQVVAVDDLITMKLFAGRSQDAADVRALKKLQQR